MTVFSRAARVGVASLLLVVAAGRAATQPVAPALPGPSLSDAAYARARYVKRVARIPMRDGVTLFTQLYVPRDAGPAATYPVVLTRTPFSTGAEADTSYPAAIAPDGVMLRDGYIFVQQEVRGRYRSQGTFDHMRPPRTAAERARGNADEISDAEDTIAWLLANVRGHNGRVALHGVSYGGFYAAMGALSRHPAIAALSLQAPTADFWFEDFHHNGAFVLTSLWAVPIFGTPRSAPTAAHWWAGAFGAIPDSAMANDYRWLLALGPLSQVSWLARDSWWQALTTHVTRDAYWQARALPAQLRAARGPLPPVLLVGGWFDAENLNGTLAVQRALAATGTPVTFAMGPFGHRQWTARDVLHTTHGALYFGDALETHVQRDIEAAFFRARLKGGGAAPRVGAHLFDIGTHQWRDLPQWPAAGARTLTWHLAAGGVVDTAAAAASQQSWTSDPLHPVPSRCTGPTIEEGAPNLVMSDDQRCLLSRDDVLTFTTATLARDLTIAGAITATLRFATSQTDADLVVKLIDVYPDSMPDHPWRADTSVHLAGYHQLVRGEILRGRFRRGADRARPFTPGRAETVTLTLPDVLHTLKAGHRLAIQVQSSWFPWFDRNPQRFLPNIFAAQATDFVSARNTLWFGGATGSRVVTPILP
jgi:putative CocE/NonD family hydrolase